MKVPIGRIGLGGCTAFILLVALAHPALAHAEFEESDPADGATVGAPPARVIASFTEPPDDASKLLVTDPCGDRADSGPTQTAGTQLAVETTGRFAGVYRVQYNVLSDLDGHPERGSFTFRVERGEECGEVTAADDAPVEESLFDVPFGAFAIGMLCAALLGCGAGYVYVATGRR